MGIDCRNLILCVLVTLGAILAAWPFAESGYMDDFSYIHMAKTLAETGRFAYNGWPTAMLGIQVWLGATWIWLFGFSFTITRLSVWPLALGTVAIAYLLASRLWKKSSSQSRRGRYTAAIDFLPMRLASQGGTYGSWETETGAAIGGLRRGL